MMKQFLFFLLLLHISTCVLAQTRVIKGTVTDLFGRPLPNVTVAEKGSNRVTLTRPNGSYDIKVASNGILVFSCLGFQTKEDAVSNKTEVNVMLNEADKSLAEVVVIGYGTVKRKDLTGSVGSVRASDLEKMPVQNVAQALQGRIAGVQVTTPEGAPGTMPAITIRGGGSITQSNEPLYVVDGVPQTEGLNFLDPTDVESMDILKDASATAIYGARGANGVVLVTTKKGKAGKSKISYDMYFGKKRVPKLLSVLSPYDFTILEYERSIDDISQAAFKSNYGPFDTLKVTYGNRPGVNWQEQVFGGTASNQYHKIGVSGGNNDTRFNLFYSHNNDEGIMLNSGSKKNVIKLGVDHKANEKMTFSGSANYSNQEVFGVGTSEGNNYFNQLQNILGYRPTFGKKGADDILIENDLDPLLESVVGNTLQNPVVNATSQTRNNLNRTLVLNGSFNFNLMKNLVYRGNVGYRISSIENDVFNGARSMAAKRSNGPFGSIVNTLRDGWNYSNTLTYSNSFNKKHNLNLMLGQEQVFDKTKLVAIDANGFDWESLELNNIGQAKTFLGRSNIEDSRIFSLFSRVNYAFDDKYMVTASFRADGSSKFGKNHKYGYFPAVALMWRMNKEEFMSKFKFLSDFRWRLSIGNTGNNRIPNYSSLSLLATGNYPLNDGNVVTVYPNILPNPNLKWEQTTSKNFGLDLGIFKQRIQLTADYYLNKTKDLLLSADIPTTTGFKTMFINAGSTQNKGFELTVNSVNIRKKYFEWSTSLNISMNRNKTLALTEGLNTLLAESNWGPLLGVADYLVEVGQPLGQMYGYKSDGLYQVSDFEFNESSKAYTLKNGIPYDVNNVPKPGFNKFIDKNSDGVINELDRDVIGNAYPKHTGGLNNILKYKGCDLNIFINWSYGNSVYNANKLYNSQTNSPYRNTLSYYADRWMSIDVKTGERITDPEILAELNKGKTVPVYNGNGANLKFYDKMVEDGSFIRISNISLGYTLPKKMASKFWASSVRVYITANNVYTFTKYSGYDPEVSSRNSSGLTPGVDFGAYPRTRSFLLGANIAF